MTASNNETLARLLSERLAMDESQLRKIVFDKNAIELIRHVVSGGQRPEVNCASGIPLYSFQAIDGMSSHLKNLYSYDGSDPDDLPEIRINGPFKEVYRDPNEPLRILSSMGMLECVPDRLVNTVSTIRLSRECRYVMDLTRYGSFDELVNVLTRTNTEELNAGLDRLRLLVTPVFKTVELNITPPSLEYSIKFEGKDVSMTDLRRVYKTLKVIVDGLDEIREFDVHFTTQGFEFNYETARSAIKEIEAAGFFND